MIDPPGDWRDILRHPVTWFVALILAALAVILIIWIQ